MASKLCVVLFFKTIKSSSHWHSINPISTGGWWNPPPPPRGFFNISQKRGKIFSSNLVTFFIDKWVTICTIKLEDRPFHVAMVMTQIDI